MKRGIIYLLRALVAVVSSIWVGQPKKRIRFWAKNSFTRCRNYLVPTHTRHKMGWPGGWRSTDMKLTAQSHSVSMLRTNGVLPPLSIPTWTSEARSQIYFHFLTVHVLTALLLLTFIFFFFQTSNRKSCQVKCKHITEMSHHEHVSFRKYCSNRSWHSALNREEWLALRSSRFVPGETTTKQVTW